jgi:hypothetical protein
MLREGRAPWFLSGWRCASGAPKSPCRVVLIASPCLRQRWAKYRCVLAACARLSVPSSRIRHVYAVWPAVLYGRRAAGVIGISWQATYRPSGRLCAHASWGTVIQNSRGSTLRDVKSTALTTSVGASVLFTRLVHS